MAYTAVTLATLQTRLNERVENSAFYATAELTLAINEALRLWNLYTGTWRRRVTIALTPASDSYFVLPQTLTFPMRIAQGTTPMEKSSLHDLDHGKPGWEGQLIGDAGIPTAPSVWAPASLTLIAYWPRVIATGVTLTVDGVSDTPVLASAGDFIDLNESRHNVLLDYAKHYLSIKRGGMELQATSAALVAFLEAAADENELFRASSFFRWAMARDDKLVTAPFREPAIRTTTRSERAARHREIR